MSDYHAQVQVLRDALRFIASITEEELQYAKIGTGAEVALRHANRRAVEALRTPDDPIDRDMEHG